VHGDTHQSTTIHEDLKHLGDPEQQKRNKHQSDRAIQKTITHKSTGRPPYENTLGLGAHLATFRLRSGSQVVLFDLINGAICHVGVG
jgi:hypothetical protein